MLKEKSQLCGNRKSLWVSIDFLIKISKLNNGEKQVLLDIDQLFQKADNRLTGRCVIRCFLVGCVPLTSPHLQKSF